MAKSSHFHWTNKVTNQEEEEEEKAASSTLNPSKPTQNKKEETPNLQKHRDQAAASASASASARRRRLQALAVSRLRSVLTVFSRNGSQFPARVIGTLFGHRRGHVHFAFQKEPSSEPAFLIELATPISGLVREMASGLVRIALECDKQAAVAGEKRPAVPGRLLEEPVWRTYCNGKKCGFATRRECGEKERKVLKAVEMVSMGAGVLPACKTPAPEGGGGGEREEEEIMYMRAKFERVVGNRDSEAFYMMNPDSNGAPELSVYLLRI